jgi:hypothetical protein
MLYEVAIIGKHESGEEELLFGPKAMLAKDPQSAVAAALAEKPGLDLTKARALVRAFGQSGWPEQSQIASPLYKDLEEAQEGSGAAAGSSLTFTYSGADLAKLAKEGA